jgi:hypothetical protein
MHQLAVKFVAQINKRAIEDDLALKFGRWRASTLRERYFEVKKKTSVPVVEPSFFLSIPSKLLTCFYFASASEAKQN